MPPTGSRPCSRSATIRPQGSPPATRSGRRRSLAPKSAADAVKLVDEDAAMKVDIVKIRVDDNLGATPKMAPEIYKAVIDEAHKKGMRVAVHLFYLEDAKAVLDA